MNCDRVTERLSARLDGGCDDLEIAALDRHIGGCSQCREIWQGLLAVRSVLGSMSSLSISEGLALRAFDAAVQAGQRGGRTLLDVVFGLGVRVSIAAGFAAIFLCVFSFLVEPRVEGASLIQVWGDETPETLTQEILWVDMEVSTEKG